MLPVGQLKLKARIEFVSALSVPSDYLGVSTTITFMKLSLNIRARVKNCYFLGINFCLFASLTAHTKFYSATECLQNFVFPSSLRIMLNFLAIFIP